MSLLKVAGAAGLRAGGRLADIFLREKGGNDIKVMGLKAACVEILAGLA